jgi:hypothetical protein
MLVRQASDALRRPVVLLAGPPGAGGKVRPGPMSRTRSLKETSGQSF